ncbi:MULTISPECIES: baseplate J/gp47 family protein [Bacillus amyloliquefaciens group]|uniref:baseplate J/gp47 family protein n=1 Tax=Bacillus amyloliquefaciens group TaxID=1938374 RepID=UPI00042F0CC1|nr:MULTISPECIES: baseplate J/gp47 family protein [Bacillus amyloliquefaciens group]AHK47799.1 phage portal protein [Bacillus velezensis TrigoCor1448]MED0777772.1 baseplate J/gp47 family protein [Bacillus siamensis]MED0777974.1 baseplate J/gp47 family protein [Bacillus siamensis]MED0832796.1 baseplate J/gp47 family protein [Bacillus siamensis]
MFEDQTFEEIMDRMLSRISADIDTREGSVIYNALAPAAAELAKSYIWLDTVLELVFSDTAQGEFLDRRATEAGIERTAATKAVRAGEFTSGVKIPVGSRFFVDNLYFQYTADGTLECETAGEAGNANISGQNLLSLDTIPGLQKAIVKEILIPGREEEDDNNLRERYFTRVRREAVSANKEHYKQWAEEVDGVGKAKVFPLWKGDGTVKIVVTDAKLEPASDILITKVSDYIDPEPGQGEGQAPIGAFVTVESAEWKEIEISASVLPEINSSIDQVKDEIEAGVLNLFKKMAFEDKVIRLSQINNIVYNSPSVSDYSDIKINGLAENLVLDDIEIPKLRQVTIVEQTR